MSRFTPWDWTTHRVVVIDVETTRSDEGFHIVEIAAVTITGPRAMSVWSTPVRPPVPMDPTSQSIHQISDHDIADAATFADIEPQLTRILTPDHRDVIVVAHKTTFDIPILRSEYRRVGSGLLNLPVIDTLDQLPAFVDLERTGRSLDATCAALGIHRTTSHTALADATDTAKAFTALLDYCIPRKVTNFAALLQAVNAHTTHEVDADLPELDRPQPAGRPLPESHLLTHNVEYDPSAPDVWLEGARQCVEFACHLLPDKRRAAFDVEDPPAGATDQLAVLDKLLAHAVQLEATHGTGAARAGFATALGAFGRLIRTLPSKSEKGNSPISAAKRWAHRWGPEADRLGACKHDTICPDCTTAAACPNDQWRRWLAERLFNVRLRAYRPDSERPKAHFLTIIGDSGSARRAMPSTYGALCEAGLAGIADELLEMACARLTLDDFERRADVMRHEAWNFYGGRGPLLTRWKATQLAARPDEAIELCEATLDREDCTTGPGRRQLVTALREHQRRRVAQNRSGNLAATPSGLAARSRRQPTRRARSLFDLDKPS